MALNTQTSIIDFLKSTGQSSDFATRKRLAEEAGISGYTGAGNQNSTLLSILSKKTPTSGISSLSGGSNPDDPNRFTSGRTEAEQAQYELDNPLAGGASGYGFDSTPESDAISEEGMGFGVPRSELGDYSSDPTYKIPTLSYGESAGLSDEYGFSGIGNKNEFAGLTRAQAIAKAEAKKAGLQKEVSQNTSFGYNTDFLNASQGAKKLLDAYSIGLKSITGDAWKVPEVKTDEANKLLENTMTDFSKLFGSATDFDKLYSQDPSFKATIDNFKAGGGNVDILKSKLPQPVAPKEDFTITSGNKDTDKILAPQTDILKQNVEYLKSVPEQYKSLYFGDTGYFTKIREDAEASVKALNESYATVAKDTLNDFEIQRQKNEAEATIRLAEIEEQRSTNKNYLNGMLAKLGALITSGEAPVAIARLDAKYDTLQAQTKTALSTAQSALASAKTKAISDLENNKLSKVATIKSDLSKSSFEIQKELMDLENETRKEINSQITDWQKEASKITQEAIKTANANKLQYDKLYAKTASGGVLSNKTLGKITSGGTGSGKFENDLDAIVGNTLATIPTKFGQEQFTAQINRARNDADKIATVASIILKGQPAEVKRDFGNQAIAVSNIDKAIALIDSGVKSGFLNNAKQYSANFFGKDYDPSLAQVNTYITSAIQPYRSSITGAAWGDQEDAEYAQLFGTTKYAPAELKQRLSTLKEIMKSKSATGLNAYVNPLDTYGNVFASGGLAPETPAVAPQPPANATFLDRLKGLVSPKKVETQAQTKVINGKTYVKVNGGWQKQ